MLFYKNKWSIENNTFHWKPSSALILNFTFKKSLVQFKNIPAVLSSSPIKILGKSFKGFMRYDQTSLLLYLDIPQLKLT